jgi:hypothetical protein
MIVNLSATPRPEFIHASHTFDFALFLRLAAHGGDFMPLTLALPTNAT